MVKLRYYEENSDGEDARNPLRRAYSETQLNQPCSKASSNSILTLNATRINIGEKIIVGWKLTTRPSPNDWIALFYEG